MYTQVRRLGQWIVTFARLQLFLTLFCLPVLILWGLPVSLLSPLGNLIFSPFLTAHLFLSSLIFFCELVCIPNGIFVKLLEWITTLWLYCMELVDSNTWNIGFTQPSLFILACLFCLTVGIMLNKYTNGLYTSLACLSIVFMLFCGYAYWLRPNYYIEEIPCNRGALVYIKTAQSTVLIDPGYLGQRLSAPTWVQYTLIPHVIKKSGTTTIEHVIILQPSITIFQALARLCLKMKIHNIYVPYWTGTDQRVNKSFFALKKQMAAKNVTLHRFGYETQADPALLSLGGENCITLQSIDRSISTGQLQYTGFKVDAQIDNRTITLYSAKCLHIQPFLQPNISHDHERK